MSSHGCCVMHIIGINIGDPWNVCVQHMETNKNV
jgi:hypothetical protein